MNTVRRILRQAARFSAMLVLAAALPVIAQDAPPQPQEAPQTLQDAPLQQAQEVHGVQEARLLPPPDGLVDAQSEPVQVTDPYIELRTGPGRAYPIFHVAERAQWIAIILRHTDWYKVRTPEGRTGWVHRRQLESTLTEAGQAKTFRDVLMDDYLSRRVQLGAAWGRFRSEPMLKLWTSYRLSDTLSAEATLGQVQGVYSGTSFWHVDLLSEPWSDQRLSPFFGIGLGRMSNVPNASLVDAVTTDAQMANATLGVRYYLSDRFVLRADYTIYTGFVSDTRSLEFRALTAGISFFFQ